MDFLAPFLVSDPIRSNTHTQTNEHTRAKSGTDFFFITWFTYLFLVLSGTDFNYANKRLNRLSFYKSVHLPLKLLLVSFYIPLGSFSYSTDLFKARCDAVKFNRSRWSWAISRSMKTRVKLAKRRPKRTKTTAAQIAFRRWPVSVRKVGNRFRSALDSWTNEQEAFITRKKENPEKQRAKMEWEWQTRIIHVVDFEKSSNIDSKGKNH